jgi:hypothetical protein
VVDLTRDRPVGGGKGSEAGREGGSHSVTGRQAEHNQCLRVTYLCMRVGV